jgi:hypothetical protein
VTQGWRELHDEELHNFYSSLKYYYDHQIKEDKMSGACSEHGGDERDKRWYERDKREDKRSSK